jgi:glycosyltransferase involved in cell wall biosynthesis
MLGTPVIGANIGGIPELIDSMKTGMLFDSGSVNNLVNFINALYSNDNLCSDMSKYCLEKQYMTMDNYYSKLLEIYGG